MNCQPGAPTCRGINRMNYRLRIRFQKSGDLRWIGHRDLVRMFERLLRRCDVPLAMSEGFHPKPRIGFPSALALGIEGRCELMDVQLCEEVSPEELQSTLQAAAPAGLIIAEIDRLPDQKMKIDVLAATYEIAVPADRLAAAETAVGDFLKRDTHEIVRAGKAPGKEQRMDARQGVLDLTVSHGDGGLGRHVLTMRLRVTRQADVRPQEVLSALKLHDLLEQGIPLVRTEIELANDPRQPCATNPADPASRPEPTQTTPTQAKTFETAKEPVIAAAPPDNSGAVHAPDHPRTFIPQDNTTGTPHP